MKGRLDFIRFLLNRKIIGLHEGKTKISPQHPSKKNHQSAMGVTQCADTVLLRGIFIENRKHREALGAMESLPSMGGRCFPENFRRSMKIHQLTFFFAKKTQPLSRGRSHYAGLLMGPDQIGFGRNLTARIKHLRLANQWMDLAPVEKRIHILNKLQR